MNRVKDDLVKKAFESAEKELEDEKIAEIKKIVKATLEKLEEAQKDREEVIKRIQVLKKDLEDLKTGRLDRIAERQKIDKDAKAISVIIVKEKEVVREKEVPTRPWWQPYEIIWNNADSHDLGYCTTSSIEITGTSVSGTSGTYCGNDFYTNSGGTYQLTDGLIRYV